MIYPGNIDQLASHEQRIQAIENQLAGYAQGMQTRLAGLEQKVASYEQQLADAAGSPVVRGALAALGIKLPDRL